MYQAIRSNDLRTISDLHGSGDYPDLSKPDDVGNYPAHLAVLFDRPEVLKFLHDKGVDLGTKCDTAGFGTPAFYCTHHGKEDMLTVLWELGYDLTDNCDKYGMPPSYYAEKKGDELTVKHLAMLTSRGTLQDVKATVIQKVERGRVARVEHREAVQLKARKNMAQVVVGCVWRGGVVRMRDNKRRKEGGERQGGEPPAAGKEGEEEGEEPAPGAAAAPEPPEESKAE